MAPYTLGGRTFEVPAATLADQREILKIQRDALKRANEEGQFSDAHIDAVTAIMLRLLKCEGLTAEALLPLLPGRDEKWKEEVRRLYVAADLIDERAPGEAVSP